MSYTLKLDWDDKTIANVIGALQYAYWNAGYSIYDRHRLEKAITDIESYVDAREEATRIARSCPGCNGEGGDHA